jgi:polysaccharide pyruvyl transferase WcaK-like protein
MIPHRREFLAGSIALAAAALLPAVQKRKPRILLRSSWQTVNIGDIAHTPGALTLLEKYLPDAEVRLWPSSINNGVDEILKKRFPKVAIVQGPEAIKTAFEECDFLLHGSGPSLVAAAHVAQWAKETKKPYGVYGITNSSADPKVIELLTNAKFVFFRDSVSMKLSKEKGVACPIMEFGPDATFACDLLNEEAATKFLKDHDLADGEFFCCIPRLRNTPYWKIRNKEMTAEDERKHKVNEAKKEQDHAPHRAAIVQIVEKTGKKVLVCPEDQSQMAVGKEMLYDPLPEAIKKRVVWREKYWLVDEATSVYKRSAGLFGNEMHSPILCIGHGIPAIVCRWAEQTSKGNMWKDIDLGDWLFDMDDEAQRAKVTEGVLKMASDTKSAKAKVAEAQKILVARQEATMKILADQLPK